MFRSSARSQLFFPAALMVTLALALLPAGWLGWLRDPAEILSIPLAPFSDAGNRARTWLRRPPPDPDAPMTGREAELIEEARKFERLYHATQLEIEVLREQLDQIRGVNLDDLGIAVDLEAASVTGRDATSIVGLLELNKGERHRVDLSTIAVYMGQHLIGRVTDIDRQRSFLTPITNSAIGLIRGRVFPRDRRDVPTDAAPQVQLTAQNDGSLTAEIASEHDINVGDVIKLTDQRWPQAAQARIVGYVERIDPKHDAPLRNIITVRPLYQPHEIARVTLMIESTRVVQEPSS